MKITDRQISNQLEERTAAQVIFPDSNSDFLSLYAQGDKGFFIKPAFCQSKKIDESVFKELCSQFTDEQEFNTNPEIIRTELSYNDFYNKYYNYV